MIIHITQPEMKGEDPWYKPETVVRIRQENVEFSCIVEGKVTLDLNGQQFDIDLSADVRFKKVFVNDTSRPDY